MCRITPTIRAHFDVQFHLFGLFGLGRFQCLQHGNESQLADVVRVGMAMHDDAVPDGLDTETNERPRV